MPLTLITGPAAEPVTSAEAKLHTKVDVSADDDLFTILIAAARERCELATRRALITQTWDLVLDGFPQENYIELPKPPLSSVTNLKYYDTSGTLQTWAASNYDVQAPAGERCARGRLALSYGVSWPSTYGELGDVLVRFVCGYGASGSSVPDLLRAAMLFDIANMYRYRTGVVTGTTVNTIPGTTKDIYLSYRSHATQRLRLRRTNVVLQTWRQAVV